LTFLIEWSKEYRDTLGGRLDTDNISQGYFAADVLWKIKWRKVMRWRPTSLLPVLLLAGSLLPLANVSHAQSLVIIAIAAIDVGEGEAGELLWISPNSAAGEARAFQAWITVQNAAGSDAGCTQTALVSLAPTAGLNSLTLYRENGSVFANNDEVFEELDECFHDAGRVIFQVGLPRPPASESGDGQDPVDPVEPRVGLPNIVSQAVYDRATLATRAATSVGGPGYQYGDTDFVEYGDTRALE